MITKPKGTYDLYGESAKYYEYALDLFRGECELSNYNFLKTPIFETSSLFHRGVGDSTDIVTKETYDFKDRGDRDMTLRPEGTAGIVRSLIENKFYANTNNYLKYYYYGPMFRYERPQSGRFREFNQFGVEVFGPMNAYIDADVIALGVKYFELLGIENVKVKLNNLGSKEDRENYKKALVEHMTKHKNQLCDDCKVRLEKNPLRILDCKVDSGKDFFRNAPKISDYLSEESNNYFTEILEALDSLEITYEIDENLVRGLDYYDYTVFEIVSDDEKLKGASTICGGGRYNNLVKTLGGPELNGIGFALGAERLIEILKNISVDLAKDKVEIYVASIDEKNMSDAFIIGNMIKDAGFKTEIEFRNTNFKNKISTADKLGATIAVIIGEEEMKKFSVKIKDLISKEETLIPINNLIEELNMKF